MSGMDAPSIITKMLSDISWEGKLVTTKYRNGGKGLEVVLTTEVLQALQYLPRLPFLCAVLSTLECESGSSLEFSKTEIQDSDVIVFPSGRFELRPSKDNHQEKIDVQPDAMLVTPESKVLIEAKRIKSSSFQEEQLARNLIISLRESGDLRSGLILILGSPPPIKVSGHSGKISISDAIKHNLEAVYNKTEGLEFPLDEAISAIDKNVAWTTWHKISEEIESSANEYQNSDRDTESSVKRLASDLTNAVEWHS